jgi:hypothetical protein
MSGEVPRGIVDRAFIAQAQAQQDSRAPLIPSRRVSGADADLIEREKARVTSENESSVFQRLTELGILFTADNKFDDSGATHVCIRKNRARIVGFLGDVKSTLVLAYEGTPDKTFKASIFSENLSADSGENIG